MPVQNEKEKTSLPPAGHARTDELKRRTDKLEELAEKQYAGVESIDPSKLEPDREIQYSISNNYLEIGVNHPFLKTKWVNCVNQHSTMVWQEKAKGWKVSTIHEFPEAAPLVREDNTIRVGDVLLMHIRIDEHLKLEQREEQKRFRQQLGIEAELHDIVGKHSNAFTVHSENTGGIPDSITSRMGGDLRRSASHQIAARTLGERLKRGTIPGVPII